MPGPLIISLSGKILLPKEKQLLSNAKVGGVVLFRENFNKESKTAKEELKKFVQDIRAINPNLLIMVDHEGGKVWRFEQGFTKLPSAKTLGELYDKDNRKNTGEALKTAFQYGHTMAKELLDCDIDMSLAPVVDLDGESNVIGKLLRAVHTDPKVVAEITEQVIRGMNAAGMPATLKHYPGHGNCTLDSHIAKPVDNRSIDALQSDLYPFRALAAKKELVFTIMTAHVTYPAVDPDNTAGFSKIWIQGCLRMGCGFSGVVMSDCLDMKGADVGETLNRIAAAQAAGCDFQMYTHQHGDKLDRLLSILDQIPDNKISNERRMTLVKYLQKKGKTEFLSMLTQFQRTATYTTAIVIGAAATAIAATTATAVNSKVASDMLGASSASENIASSSAGSTTSASKEVAEQHKVVKK